MTKTEYRQYIASEHWQKSRKVFLAKRTTCARCDMPRWFANILYDQDLNVHHKSYANLGNEQWGDLEALCCRCHELETFGYSDLPVPKFAKCNGCGKNHLNIYDSICESCAVKADFVRQISGDLSHNGYPMNQYSEMFLRVADLVPSARKLYAQTFTQSEKVNTNSDAKKD